MEHLLDPTLLIPLVLVGLFAGFVGGLLGIGGGALFVPLLMYLLPQVGVADDVVMHTAIGTSLSIIIVTGAVSTFTHLRMNNADYRSILWLAAGGIPGVRIGAWLASSMGGATLATLFACYLGAIGVRFLMPGGPKPRTEEEGPATARPSLLMPIGLIAGLSSGIFGVGGGVVTVPLLVMLHRYATYRAVGNSAGLVVLAAIAGTLSYAWEGLGNALLPGASIGFVYLPATIVIGALVVPAARLGAMTTNKVNAMKLRKGFGVLLLIVAVRILWRVWASG